MHLNAVELIDVAEGTRSEASVPHLASCDACRRQLTDMRAMMSTVAAVEVPEPSPLFWDHLSQRVRNAVAEDVPRRSWQDAATWRRLLMPLSAVAVASLIVAMVLSSRALAPQSGTHGDPERVALRSRESDPERVGRRTPPAPSPPSTTVAASGATIDLLNDPASDDDVSLTLVASLTADLDLDAAGEAGLAPHGSAEHAVTHMNDDELRELRRLLKEQLAPSGA
jgi:hypothetical protein